MILSVTAAKGLGQLIGFLIIWIRGRFARPEPEVAQAPQRLFYPSEWIANLKA